MWDVGTFVKPLSKKTNDEEDRTKDRLWYQASLAIRIVKARIDENKLLVFSERLKTIHSGTRLFPVNRLTS